MVERRGHRHGHTNEYRQLSIKVQQTTYEKLKKRVDKSIFDLSNISAVVETACINYLEDETRCYNCGNRISMDFNICPYCAEPILVDVRQDRSYCLKEYLKAHPEYQDTERYKFQFSLDLIEMRKILDGDCNFTPRNIRKIDKMDVEIRREMHKCLFKNAELMRIQNKRKMLRKANKE